VTGPPGDAPTADLSICGAFSCPYCYLASRRTDRLAGTPITIGWQMVAPRLRLPAASRPGGAGREVLQAELDAARELLLPGEQLPSRAGRPAHHRTSRRRLRRSRRCWGRRRGARAAVRRLLAARRGHRQPRSAAPLLAAPIRRGHSTAWPLRDSGYAVTLAGGPVTTQAYYRIRDWQDSWRQLGAGNRPVLTEAGSTLTGAQALSRLGDAVHEQSTAPRGTAAAGPSRLPVAAAPAGGPAPLSFSAADQVRVMAGGRTPQGYIRPAITQTRQTRRRSCHLKAAHNSRHRHPRPPAITGAVATAKQTDQTLTHASGGGGSDRPVLPADARGATPPVGRLRPGLRTRRSWRGGGS